ncbi:MAG: endolytic transglycosylase MltG [Alphaproteobacteria bacterium]|jgi:UPF0755 protein|nr:endolytic transglycosylase MltG [Alphaproteobacteria bacterium]
MFRWLGSLFATITALAVVAVGVIAWLVHDFRSPGPLEEPTVLEIPRGAGLNSIALRLEDAGVIADSFRFRVGVALSGAEADLKAGEYEFPAGISGEGAMAILREGRTLLYTLTIPEGLTTAEILALVEGEERLSGEIETRPPQGSLLPETYAFTRGDDRQGLIDRMAEAMDETVAALWAERAEDLPLETPQDAVILASIIEKETGVDAEREVVASVFVNRLNQGMPLQTDPTVIFAMTQGEYTLDRPLNRNDIQTTDSPYNTYLYPGLPPGPIAHPGRDSLEAALNPAESDYLYFVADGTGGHAFARTLDEHNANVRAWRRIRDGEGG